MNPNFFNIELRPNAPCIEFSGHLSKAGYGMLQVGDRRPKLAHRVSYTQARGIPLSDIDGLVVMHTCDNPACFNPEHLKLGTLQENNADMRVKGRASRTHQPKGSNHGNSKLTNEIVLYIRGVYKRRSSEFGARALGRKFNIAAGIISGVALGKSWKHV